METQRTSTSEAPRRPHPPRGLNLTLTKSNRAGRDNIFPFLFLSSSQRFERRDEGRQGDKGGGTSGGEKETGGDGGERDKREREPERQQGREGGEKNARTGEKRLAESFKKDGLQDSTEEITSKTAY